MTRIMALGILSLTAAVGPVVAQTSTLTRTRDPAVALGESLPSLLGVPVDEIVAFRYQGGWVQIRKSTWGLDLSGQQGAAGFSPRGLANGWTATSGIHTAGGIGGLLAAVETQGTSSAAAFFAKDQPESPEMNPRRLQPSRQQLTGRSPAFRSPTSRSPRRSAESSRPSTYPPGCPRGDPR